MVAAVAIQVAVVTQDISDKIMKTLREILGFLFFKIIFICRIFRYYNIEHKVTELHSLSFYPLFNSYWESRF